MRAFQISAIVETAVRDERERGIIRSKALEDAARQALEALAAWDALIEHQYSGTRVGMSDLSYAAQATPPVMEALRAALAEPVSKDQA